MSPLLPPDRQHLVGRRATSGLLLGLGLVALTTCKGDTKTGPDPVTLKSVSVAPTTSTLVALGATVQLEATAQDQNGNAIAGAAFTWASSDESVASVDGSGLVTAAGANGNATITATAGGVSGTATIVGDLPAGATLDVTGITDPITAGTSSDVTVTVRDADGNVATAYTGTVSFTSTDATATLPDDYTFVASDSGVHTFAGGVVLVTAGEHTVTAADVADAGITGAQADVTVTAAQATTLVVTGIDDPITAATSANVTVTAMDDHENVAVDYTGTVTFASTDPGATLPSDYAFVAGDAGAHTFAGAVTFATAGEQSVTASDVDDGTISGSQAEITVEPSTATVVFSEDFESGLGLWSVDNGMWAIGLPTSGPNECFEGTQCAATVLGGNYPFSGSRLISPTVTLPALAATEELHLRFRHWFSMGSATGGNPDRGVVAIQERTAPGVWGAQIELGRYQLSAGGVWTLPMVDLSAYAGSTVRILFHMQGSHSFNSGPGWYLDNVSISVVPVPGALPFSEGFEDGIGSWSASNGQWEVGLPGAGPSACHTGTQCAGTVLDGNYPFNRSSLASPTLGLPSVAVGEELQLRFWHWFSTGSATGGNPDRAHVLVQEYVSPGVWSASTDLAQFQLSSGGVWTLPLVDLTAYAGSTIRLLFEMRGSNSFNSGAGWYLDDVSIAVVPVDPGLPFADGFEDGIDSWAVSNGSWDVGLPTAGPSGCNTGDQCAGTVLHGNYPFNRSSLVSKAFDLPTISGAQEILLRFWHWFSFGGATGGVPDRGVVYIQEWTGTEWAPAVDMATFQASSGGVWSSPLVDLSAHGGETVRVLFELQGSNAFNSGAGWYVDDVTLEVAGAPAGEAPEPDR